MTTGDGTGQTLTFPEHLLRTLGHDSFCWKDTVVGGTGSHLVAMRESLSETGTNPRGKRYTHIKGLESWSQGHAQSQVFLGLSSFYITRHPFLLRQVWLSSPVTYKRTLKTLLLVLLGLSVLALHFAPK